jgi:hypothetical protein
MRSRTFTIGVNAPVFDSPQILAVRGGGVRITRRVARASVRSPHPLLH